MLCSGAQAESMNTVVTTNRHKDMMKWKGLVREYDMKISYLERALAQEESKLRIAEQVTDSCSADYLYVHFFTVAHGRGASHHTPPPNLP